MSKGFALRPGEPGLHCRRHPRPAPPAADRPRDLTRRNAGAQRFRAAPDRHGQCRPALAPVPAAQRQVTAARAATWHAILGWVRTARILLQVMLWSGLSCLVIGLILRWSHGRITAKAARLAELQAPATRKRTASGVTPLDGWGDRATSWHPLPATAPARQHRRYTEFALRRPQSGQRGSPCPLRCRARPARAGSGLLAGTPARSLAQAMTDMVEMLKRIDIDRVARRQGWWSRFTGADLEARVELEVAAHSLSEAMRQTAAAAGAARRAQAAMRADLPRASTRHRSRIRHWPTIPPISCAAATPPIPWWARLHRRLGNLEALHASNRLTRAQMALAIDHLSGLLDRFTDIEQLLFPVWRQHALAVAQGSAGAAPESGTLSQFQSIHARFEGAPRFPKDQRLGESSRPDQHRPAARRIGPAAHAADRRRRGPGARRHDRRPFAARGGRVRPGDQQTTSSEGADQLLSQARTGDPDDMGGNSPRSSSPPSRSTCPRSTANGRGRRSSAASSASSC